jgi:hypothetical protein
VFRRSRLGWGIWTRLSHHLTPARKSTPTRMKPSRAVSYTADTRHRALGGAMVPTILSERSDKFITLSYRATPAPSVAHSSFGTY